VIYIRIMIFIIFIFNLNTLAKDIQIQGKVVKLLDIGKRTPYFNKYGEPIFIIMPTKNNKTVGKGTIYSKGGFKFKKRIPKKYIGKEFQFKINENWFILSPFNGKFFLPRYSTPINLIIIPKNSQLYMELFKIVDFYSIQTFATHSRIKADLQLKNLQNFCIRNAKKNSFYCKKYVKKIPIINPNRDPLYKIYYNRYNSYSNAKKDLKLIRKLKGLEKSFIVSHTVIDTDFF